MRLENDDIYRIINGDEFAFERFMQYYSSRLYHYSLGLLDKNTLQPKYTFLDSEPALSDWIEGSPKTYTFNLKLTDVAAGDYLWAVGLVDTTKDNTIGIQISAKKDRLTTEGWLKLCDVTVH